MIEAFIGAVIHNSSIPQWEKHKRHYTLSKSAMYMLKKNLDQKTLIGAEQYQKTVQSANAKPLLQPTLFQV